MPQALEDATKDRIAEKIDKQARIDRIRAGAAYLLMPDQRADAEGHRRVMCPEHQPAAEQLEIHD